MAGGFSTSRKSRDCGGREGSLEEERTARGDEEVSRR